MEEDTGLDALVQRCEDLELQPSISDAHAQAFLSEWPVPRLLAALGAPSLTDAQIAVVTTVVTRVFSAAAVASDPSDDAVEGFQRAAQATDFRFRRLAVECAGAALRTAGPPAAAGGALPDLLAVCVGGLADEDTGVGAAATECLLKMASLSNEHLETLLSTQHDRFRDLAASESAEVRARCAGLLARLAALSEHAMHQVGERGLFAELARELDAVDSGVGLDTLACVVALDSLRGLAEDAPGPTGAHLYEQFMPRVMRVLEHPDGDALTHVAAVSSGVMLVVAAARAASPGVDAPGASGMPHKLLQHVAAALGDPELEEGSASAFLDAVARLGASKEGAMLALSHGLDLADATAGYALGERSPEACRVAALHALAAMLGADRGPDGGEGSRAGADRGSSETARTSVERGSDLEAPPGMLLPDLFEAAAQRAVEAGPSMRGDVQTAAESVENVLLSLLQKPFEDLRVAVYRFVTSLAPRRWGLARVMSSFKLIERLCDPTAESGMRPCQWRHAAVCSVASALSRLPEGDPLLAFASTVLHARDIGPFGVPGSGPAIPAPPVALPR